MNCVIIHLLFKPIAMAYDSVCVSVQLVEVFQLCSTICYLAMLGMFRERQPDSCQGIPVPPRSHDDGTLISTVTFYHTGERLCLGTLLDII